MNRVGDEESSARTGQATSMARSEGGASQEADQALDDRGTNQTDASTILKQLRDQAFAGSSEKLAVALGRPTEEIEAWTTEAGAIDADVLLKARALATERGVEIE